MPIRARDVQERIDSIRIQAGDPRVALALIELSRNPEAEIEDYARLSQADPEFAGRLLSLVNSSWFSPGAPVKSVKQAICTLGLSQIKALILSHCVASLHTSLGLDATRARSLWGATMCKALAAAKLVDCTVPGQAEEAFMGGVFQDIGVALLTSIDAGAHESILSDPDVTVARQIERERALFGMDHTLVGRKLADELGLPEVYVRAIANHHRWPVGQDGPAQDTVEVAVQLASLFPHDLRWWPAADSRRLAELLARHPAQWDGLEHLVAVVQEEFAAIDELLNQGAESAASIEESLRAASQGAARETVRLVGQVNVLSSSNDRLLEAAERVDRARREAERRAGHDPLTGLLNREGWSQRAAQTLSRAGGPESWMGIAFFDLDGFKAVNDEHGHAAGDAFLVEVAERVRAAVRSSDLVCRWGGDEILILFLGMSQPECTEAMRRVKEHVESRPIECEGASLPVSLSGGFVSTRVEEIDPDLSCLIQQADECLYRAKRMRPGSVVSCQPGR